MNNKQLSHNHRNAEIIPAEQEYPLLETRQAMTKILERLDEHLGAGRTDVIQLQLPRIKVSRELALFQIQTPEGSETAHALTGVITAFRPIRTYWGKPYAGGNDRPMCSSLDGFVSVPDGSPGGVCADCPLSKYGTARNPDGSEGEGQACQEKRQLLFLLPGQVFPHLMDIGPTSLKNFRKWESLMLYSPAPYWAVITKLTLETVPTKSGFPVPRVILTQHKRLSADQAAILEPYHQRMLSLLKPMVIEADFEEIVENQQPGGQTIQAAPEDPIPF